MGSSGADPKASLGAHRQGVLWAPSSCTGPPGVGGTQGVWVWGAQRQPGEDTGDTGEAANGSLRPPEAGGGRAGPGASPHWRRRLSGRQGRGRGRRNLPGLGAAAAGAGQDALRGAAAAALGLPPSPPPPPAASGLPRQPRASSSSSSSSRRSRSRAGERQPCARRAPRCRR